MENASKALIIAGAILVSIVLIAIGVLIVNNLQGITSTASEGMDKQAIEAFNSTWEAYEGKRVSGSTVLQLLSSVRTNNIKLEVETVGNDETKAKAINKVIVVKTASGGSGGFTTPTTHFTSDQLQNLRTSINSGKYYEVTLKVNTTTGLINEITIK